MTTETKEEYEYAASLVSYNKDTGEIFWLRRPSVSHGDLVFNGKFAGEKAGTLTPDGYIKLGLEYKGRTINIKGHRLAWFMYYGALPEMDIDHINQRREDNRIENLRDVPRSLNQRNQKRRIDNSSGFTGVTKNKRDNKWTARVKVDGKDFYLGSYVCIESALDKVKSFRAAHGFSNLHGAA